ncbi:MAG: Sec-independent protein translocase TatA [Denitrovibrio sp.]|nr:MAG: Sec-independent protein translocase TatA [Denitrovibrio sp.]
MFGLGMSEVILIMAVALIVIGPKKLPEVAKGLGKGYAEFKKYMTDFKDAVNIEMDTTSKKQEKKTNAEDLYEEHYKDTTIESETAKSKDKPEVDENAKG